MNEPKMVTKKTWKEFRACTMLWWVNRLLHTFGWAIVLEFDENNEVVDAYPARVKFRGFCEEDETTGFIGISKYMKENAEFLYKEASDAN